MRQCFKKIENDSKLKNLHDRFNNYRSTNYNSKVLGRDQKFENIL